MKRAQTEIRTAFFLQRYIRRNQINNIVPASHLFYDFFTINQRLSLLKKSLYILLFYTFFYFPLFLHKKFGDKISVYFSIQNGLSFQQYSHKLPQVHLLVYRSSSYYILAIAQHVSDNTHITDQ